LSTRASGGRPTSLVASGAGTTRIHAATSCDATRSAAGSASRWAQDAASRPGPAVLDLPSAAGCAPDRLHTAAPARFERLKNRVLDERRREQVHDLDGMEVPGRRAGTSLASCRGLPAGCDLAGSANICGRSGWIESVRASGWMCTHGRWWPAASMTTRERRSGRGWCRSPR
jgi:hypothetical protein